MKLGEVGSQHIRHVPATKCLLNFFVYVRSASSIVYVTHLIFSLEFFSSFFRVFPYLKHLLVKQSSGIIIIVITHILDYAVFNLDLIENPLI